MKIAIVGNFKWAHYQQALLDGFKSIPQCENAFPVKLNYYPNWNLIGLLQNTIRLWNAVKLHRPDVLFLYRVDYMFPCVLPLLKKRYKIRIAIYHNDDPYYRSWQRRFKHYFFLKSIKYSDITYVYREANLPEAKALGAPRVKLMRSHYYSKTDVQQSHKKSIANKEAAIVFIGHYEADSRISFLNALFQANVNIHIYGSENWTQAFYMNNWPLTHLHPPVYNEDYRSKLNSSYAALAFFSERNRDDYTRRCFEIPMAYTLLFAPRTTYMQDTFSDGNNVILFNNTEDIVAKAKLILNDPQRTEAITTQGHDFILNGGFSEKDAAQMILTDLIALQ